MRKVAFLFAIVLMIAALGWGQQPAATAAAPAQAVTEGQAATGVPDGTIVAVEAKQSVETKKAKVGDSITLEANEDGKDDSGKTVKGADGKPVVPRKTKFTGKVSSVKASSKESKEARLSVLVTSATFPDGRKVPFLGVVMGPFRSTGLDMNTGIDTRGGAGFAKEGKGLDTPEVPSGIAGVEIKIDPQLGTVLVSPNNFAIDKGTTFHVRYVDLSKHPAAESGAPPSK